MFTFLSGAKSAIKACLLLPKMLSDFLKAYTQIKETHARFQAVVIEIQVLHSVQVSSPLQLGPEICCPGCGETH